MRVVVTGSSGFIGAATMRHLVAEGHTAVAYDLANGDDVRHTPLPDCDAVIHLAGLLGTSELFDDVHNAIDVNVHGAAAILSDCERVGAAYVGITMPCEDRLNVYSATKKCQKTLAEAWGRYKGLRVAHVRAFNAYGPGQKHGPGHPQKIIPTFATQAWAGEPLPIWGDGQQKVDLVHVDDVARMLVEVAVGLVDEDDAAVSFRGPRFRGQTFDAGTGIANTVLQVAHQVCEVAGAPHTFTFLPMRPGEDSKLADVADGEGWGLVTRPCLDADRVAEAVRSYKP